MACWKTASFRFSSGPSKKNYGLGEKVETPASQIFLSVFFPSRVVNYSNSIMIQKQSNWTPNKMNLFTPAWTDIACQIHPPWHFKYLLPSLKTFLLSFPLSMTYGEWVTYCHLSGSLKYLAANFPKALLSFILYIWGFHNHHPPYLVLLLWEPVPGKLIFWRGGVKLYWLSCRHH